jgi:hypothetical protein
MRQVFSAALLAAGIVLGVAASSEAAPVAIANHSFQLPARAGDGNVNDEDAYDVAAGNEAPTNWTFINTANDNYGQARPNPTNQFTRDTTSGETAPFTQGGFDGDLILFGNMNTVGASLTADSDVAGQLAAGAYTLTVALGARNTGSWNDLDYTIGLVGGTSGPLGTVTAVTLNPGDASMNTASSAWTTSAYNVVDVTYSLNVPVGSSMIGENYFVRITGANSGFKEGVVGTAFAQAAVDNVRLDFVPVPEPATGTLVSGALALAALRFRKRRA